MEVLFDWVPDPVAASLRGQPPELLMLIGGLIVIAIVLVFQMTMRR